MKKFLGTFKSKAKKFSAVFCAALMSMCMFVTSFAADGSTASVDYSAIGEAFKAGVADAVTGTITAVSAMIPVCISIIGLGICIKTFKKFIGKLT